MRSKVSLSLAMAHTPDLLILDEPTSGLDAMVRREFLESMVDVAAEGRTVLLSSHQIDEVERVADVVVILRQGKLALVERLDALKQNVRELTITRDIGSPHYPEVPGTVIRGQEHDRRKFSLSQDSSTPTGAKPKSSDSTAKNRDWKSAAASDTCPNSRHSTTG